MSTHQERVSAATLKVYERVVTVYDMILPGGKIYRWDSVPEARRFAQVNRFSRITVVKIPAKYVREAAALVNRTTPNALVRKSVKRKLVKDQPHEVQKD